MDHCAARASKACADDTKVATVTVGIRGSDGICRTGRSSTASGQSSPWKGGGEVFV